MKISLFGKLGEVINVMDTTMKHEKASKRYINQSTESAEQQALFEWAMWYKSRYPALEYMFHIANGGLRHPAIAKRLKAEGVKPGVPDIFLPVQSGGYNGLFIELKIHYNKPTAEQKRWLKALNDLGYYAVVCYGWHNAVDVILGYLGGEPI